MRRARTVTVMTGSNQPLTERAGTPRHVSEITVTRRTEGLAEVVAVAGEIDIATCHQLRAMLATAVDAGPGTVIVDMTGVEWIDSTGMGTLVGALKRARAKHGTVRVAGASDRIAKHFTVTGLAKLFGMHATVGDALAVTAEAEVTP